MVAISQEKESFVLNSLLNHNLLESLIETISKEGTPDEEGRIKYNFDLPSEFIEAYEKEFNSNEEEIGQVISVIIEKALKQYLNDND